MCLSERFIILFLIQKLTYQVKDLSSKLNMDETGIKDTQR